MSETEMTESGSEKSILSPTVLDGSRSEETKTVAPTPRYPLKTNPMGSIRRRAWNQSECLHWTGSISPEGYGRINRLYVHRVVYEECFGPIPAGKQIDHLCRVRDCFNPAHLEAVTHRENILRGVSASARNAQKTHCVHGHELSVENTYLRKDKDGRGCLRCRRRQSAESNAKIAEKNRLRGRSGDE